MTKTIKLIFNGRFPRKMVLRNATKYSIATRMGGFVVWRRLFAIHFLANDAAYYLSSSI